MGWWCLTIWLLPEGVFVHRIMRTYNEWDFVSPLERKGVGCYALGLSWTSLLAARRRCRHLLWQLLPGALGRSYVEILKSGGHGVLGDFEDRRERKVKI